MALYDDDDDDDEANDDDDDDDDAEGDDFVWFCKLLCNVVCLCMSSFV